MLSSFAPIVLFVYNRPHHTQQTFTALVANQLAPESELFIFADGPKPGCSAKDLENIAAVRKLIWSFTGFKKITITESETNRGLSKSIIAGVTQILQAHNSIIVLEDDMITSPYFLNYMNDGLIKYAQNDAVVCIHGYTVPIDFNEASTFFIKGADCWGWGTWKRGWDIMNYDATALKDQILQLDKKYEFDFNGTYPYFEMLEKTIRKEVDSWAILWYASAFLSNKLTLYPFRSLIKNIGNDETATHRQDKKSMNVEAGKEPVALSPIPITESVTAKKLMSKYFYSFLGLRKKIKRTLHIGY
jgi:Glycosyl transferase family 2